MIYAGIGSRQTPRDILGVMTLLARNLSEAGWKLRSGHAFGADQAFEEGTMNREIFLPWPDYNIGTPGKDGFYHIPMNPPLRRIAEQYHPNWVMLSPGVQKLMCRNVNIILGANLDTPVDMVICWTPGGEMVGGTSHALRHAIDKGIPYFNLAIQADWEKLDKFVCQFPS